MREPTKEERENINKYVESISVPTGIKFPVILNITKVKKHESKFDFEEVEDDY